MENKRLDKTKVLLTMLLEEILPETGICFYNQSQGEKLPCDDEVVYSLLEDGNTYNEFLTVLTEKLDKKLGEYINGKF